MNCGLRFILVGRREESCFLIFLVVRIVVVLCLRRFAVLLFLLVVLFLLLGLLNLAPFLPLLREHVCLSHIIRDDDVVEDGAALHLPQVETDESEIGIPVDIVVVLVFRVRDFLCLPHPFVSWVGDALHGPLTLVIGIVLHRGLPFAIFLIIPVVRLLRIRIDNPLFLDPIAWFLAFGVVHHGTIHPIAWFLVVRVGNFLRLQHLTVLLQRSLINLLFVDFHSHRVVWFQQHAVDMGRALALLLVCQIGLLQYILALVVENEVRSFGIAALVRTEHDVVGCRVAKCRRIIQLWAYLHIPTSALDILLILRLVMDDQILAFVAKRFEIGSDSEELRVRTRLDTGVFFFVFEPLASGCYEFSLCALALLPLARCPPAFPPFTECFLEIDFPTRHTGRTKQQNTTSHSCRRHYSTTRQVKIASQN